MKKLVNFSYFSSSFQINFQIIIYFVKIWGVGPLPHPSTPFKVLGGLALPPGPPLTDRLYIHRTLCSGQLWSVHIALVRFLAYFVTFQNPSVRRCAMGFQLAYWYFQSSHITPNIYKARICAFPFFLRSLPIDFPIVWTGMSDYRYVHTATRSTGIAFVTYIVCKYCTLVQCTPGLSILGRLSAQKFGPQNYKRPKYIGRPYMGGDGFFPPKNLRHIKGI